MRSCRSGPATKVTRRCRATYVATSSGFCGSPASSLTLARSRPWTTSPNHPLQQTAAAMLVLESSMSLSAAAAAERGRSAAWVLTGSLRLAAMDCRSEDLLMSQDFPERDWKILREVHAAALNR